MNTPACRAQRPRASRKMRHKSTSRSRVPRAARRSNPALASTFGPRPPHSGKQDLGQEVASAPRFPIVGIGASAGGLEAFTQLLRALPTDTGMAFVFVQHLDPTRESALAGILARATPKPAPQAHER